MPGTKQFCDDFLIKKLQSFMVLAQTVQDQKLDGTKTLPTIVSFNTLFTIFTLIKQTAFFKLIKINELHTLRR